MALYQLKSSFAGGELSPSMYGRTDIAKYDSGAAVLRNFSFCVMVALLIDQALSS